jgi:hypothetical protein
MPTHRVAPVLALLLALFAPHARAFLDPPYITPANPVASDAISVSIHGGECDAPYVGLEWPPPVTQQGNDITIHLIGYHDTNPELCYISVGTWTYPLGTYLAGSYTLYVEWRYMSFSGAWIQETLGIIPFTVTGGAPPPAPVTAPTLGIAGLSILLLTLAGFAVQTLRKS